MLNMRLRVNSDLRSIQKNKKQENDANDGRKKKKKSIITNSFVSLSILLSSLLLALIFYSPTIKKHLNAMEVFHGKNPSRKASSHVYMSTKSTKLFISQRIYLGGTPKMHILCN